MIRMLTAVVAAGCSFAVFSSGRMALAHPGHGDPQHPEGLVHYATTPSHYIVPAVLIGVAAIGLLVRRVVRAGIAVRQRNRD